MHFVRHTRGMSSYENDSSLERQSIPIGIVAPTMSQEPIHLRSSSAMAALTEQSMELSQEDEEEDYC